MDRLRFGGQVIGTELLYADLGIVRLTPPVEQDGLLLPSARIFDTGANLIHRPSFTIFYEAASQYEFLAWMIQTARMMQSVRRDVVAEWSEGTITWPQCLFTGFSRPVPGSVAESRFSDSIVASFVTDQEPT